MRLPLMKSYFQHPQNCFGGPSSNLLLCSITRRLPSYDPDKRKAPAQRPFNAFLHEISRASPCSHKRYVAVNSKQPLNLNKPASLNYKPQPKSRSSVAPTEGLSPILGISWGPYIAPGQMIGMPGAESKSSFWDQCLKAPNEFLAPHTFKPYLLHDPQPRKQHLDPNASTLNPEP